MTRQNNAAPAVDKPKARTEFNAWLKRVENAPLYWNQSDAMLAAFVAGHAEAMYKLRVLATDEARDDIAASLQDSAYCTGLQRGFMLGNHNDNDGLRRALESRDGYVKAIKDTRAVQQSGQGAGR